MSSSVLVPAVDNGQAPTLDRRPHVRSDEQPDATGPHEGDVSEVEDHTPIWSNPKKPGEDYPYRVQIEPESSTSQGRARKR